MLQESSLARQTRRPIFSLEAGPPRETGCSSAAGHVRQPASAIHAVRMDGGSPGPARVGEPPMAQERSGALPWTASVSNEREGMFLANKAAWAGVVFIFLATGISGPRPTPLASGANLKEEPGVGRRDRDDIEKMQETLRDKGHYRGKVDGVFGLRTRASIRAYQKAENLPVTGQVDTRTADGLGVRPEGHVETGNETTKGKPSAGIKWA
jgi:Putative peptidoglycan binding domain